MTRVIDAHHHIWRLHKTPWLNGPQQPRIFGDYAAIQRDYLIDEFAQEAVPHGVDASVYVQINVAPGEEVEEVEYVSDQGARAGLMQSIVAYADLAASSVGETLDRLREAGPVRGIRQQLHWHENPIYRFAPTADGMLDPSWQQGLRQVSARNLHFELQVFVGQLDDSLTLVDAFDDTQFVLLHAGMIEDRSAEGWDRWKVKMTDLARRDNIAVKLSGIGTFTHRCTVEDWKPIVERTVDIFGPDRCMFGSNFPVEKLWTSYANLIDVFTQCIADLTPSEQTRILRDNASELYQIT